jgi:hypothetical protein
MSAIAHTPGKLLTGEELHTMDGSGLCELATGGL